MRNARLILLAAVLAACSTPQSRIKKNQAAFDAYPAEIQQNIRAGKADLGFTPEQVRMALGKPDRVYTRKTEKAAQEVWAYGRSGGGGPSVGFGFGMATGGPASYGLGFGVGGPGYYDAPDDRVRVVFEKGMVVSVENREK